MYPNLETLTPMLLALILAPSAALGQELLLSTETTLLIDGYAVSDEQVVSNDPTTGLGAQPLPPLPDAADVDAYHLAASGDQLFSLDSGHDLGAGVVAGPGDVVRFDGVANQVLFGARAEGLPEGADLDAVTEHDSGDLMFSLDTTWLLPNGQAASDEDLVRFDASQGFQVYFDGSAQGVPSGLDLDGAHYRQQDGLLLVSFDGEGLVGGVLFRDEDVLAYDASSSSWELFHEGAQHPDLASVDAVALPEPWLASSLAWGAAAIAALRQRRVRSRVGAAGSGSLFGGRTRGAALDTGRG